MIKIIVIIAIIIAAAAYYMRIDQRQVFNLMPTSPKVVSVSQSAVSITPEGFNPQVIIINKGEDVIWTNKDSKMHQIYADPHPSRTSLPELDSGSLKKGDAYTFTFEKSGTFTYHDGQNPLKILGTVIVR